MKINRGNYEAYFLDYHEGQLSLAMVEEVLLFVDENPDLKIVFDEFDAVSLVADQDIVFEKKSSLKKNQIFATSQVDELNYEEYLISETEGLLNAEQLASIEEFISINPQFEKERRLFSLAHLSTEDEIVFEAKESLKKKAIPVGAINADTFETLMARELEGDLNPDEKLQLAEFMLYNPHLEKDRKLYKHTILSAETDIIFEDKNSLKQNIIPLRRIVYYALSAAASLALIFSVYFLLNRNDIPQSIAEQGKIKNAVNKVITEPSSAIPDNQVAVNNNPSNAVLSKPGQTISGTAKTSVTTGNDVVTSRINEPIAYDNRNAVEMLQSRSARKITTRSYVDPQYTFIRVSQVYSNKNLEFYYNMKLAEEIQYAQLNSKDKNPAKTIFDATLGKVGGLFAQNRTAPAVEEKKNLSLWTFAELGVQTFNTVTSSDLELNLKKDEEGKVVGYDLESSNIDIEKDLRK